MQADNPLPWTDRNWDELRAVALEAARKSRVASTFLPLVGPFPPDQATVPSNWLEITDPKDYRRRLEVRAGKTLQLVTLSCNIYLRGSEISDPDLVAAKSMVRRAGEVLGRLEDAVVFYGLPPDGDDQEFRGKIQPKIYTVSGGKDMTGLLQAANTVYYDDVRQKKGAPKGLRKIEAKRKARIAAKQAGGAGLRAAKRAYRKAVKAGEDLLMNVALGNKPTGEKLVEGVVTAIQRLEGRGHFGPFGVVLGHQLFSAVTTPTPSLVLPTDRLAEFLDGRRVQRSGLLPPTKGLVVALGGQPIELVLASDIDVRFLQATLEPRYVLRVFERLVLRIKELDAVCCLTSDGSVLDPGFKPRGARA
jgi:uncharacterized linocin/CFP29 family protein